MTTRLPADYVRDAVELGYATTIHTAQGTTVDTLHGLITGTESRQDLYTMLTRGRDRNEVYIAAGATTGNPHDLITPDAIHPRAAREILETVLDRDGAATSATTELQHASHPSQLWQPAAHRYADAFMVAAEDLLSPARINDIGQHADQIAAGTTDGAAWPTLRARLIHYEADGYNAIKLLDYAARGARFDTAIDPAAVLNWRIHTIIEGAAHSTDDHRITTNTPVPKRLTNHPVWGDYLHARRDHANQRWVEHLEADMDSKPYIPQTHPPRAQPQVPTYDRDRGRPIGPSR